MADICLIYAHPNKAKARSLYNALSRNYSVWWDEHIHSGDYRTEIEHQLSEAKCVIPIWCKVSRSEQNVTDEAAFAKRHNIPLLPVRIEDAEPPLGFGGFHTINLTDWNDDPDAKVIGELLKNIAQTINAKPRLLRREFSLKAGSGSFPLPLFFHSVSSHETALHPEAALQALSLYRPDALLVSAYDVINTDKTRRDKIISHLHSCRSAGILVLMDSGNYEAFRKHDKTWKTEQLHKAFKITPHDIAFCFDDLNPPNTVDGVVRGVTRSISRSTKSATAPVLPIVHAPRNSKGNIIFDLIPQCIKKVSRELRPELVAIPERELGDGILTRARTVFLIRRALDELGYYQSLHLLGTGNPLTIAILAAVGADSFDGLEWCRTVADSQSGRLYHMQQYDLFRWQSEAAT
ncbi:MAG TPA: toll/interleukin-1 receptor domain-containing protein, partial [Terriglobales bacterium]